MARKRRWLVLPERYDSGRHKAHVSGDPVNTADTFRRGTDVDNGSFGIKLPKDLFGPSEHGRVILISSSRVPYKGQNIFAFFSEEGFYFATRGSLAYRSLSKEWNTETLR
jgi:hypothetical protein